MAKNIQEVLDVAQHSALAQLATQPNTINNYSKGLQDGIKKIGLSSFVAASLFFANMGTAQASSTSDALKVAAGISALVGVVNNDNYALNLPAACNIRGVNGWKIGGATFGGSALFSAFGKGNGQKLMMALGGYLGGRAALSYEEARIAQEMQDCAMILDQMNSYQRAASLEQRQAPKFLSTATDPNAIVFYTFPDSNNRPVFMTWKSSPSVASMSDSKLKGLDINKNPKAFAEFDKALDQLKMTYNNFEKVSYQWLTLNANQQNIDYAMTLDGSAEAKQKIQDVNVQNRATVQQAADAFQKLYNEYVLSRGNFMAIADASVLEGFSLREHKQSIKLLQMPPVAMQACNCDLKEAHNILNNSITDRVRVKLQR